MRPSIEGALFHQTNEIIEVPVYNLLFYLGSYTLCQCRSVDCLHQSPESWPVSQIGSAVEHRSGLDDSKRTREGKREIKRTTRDVPLASLFVLVFRVCLRVFCRSLEGSRDFVKINKNSKPRWKGIRIWSPYWINFVLDQDSNKGPPLFLGQRRTVPGLILVSSDCGAVVNEKHWSQVRIPNKGRIISKMLSFRRIR